MPARSKEPVDLNDSRDEGKRHSKRGSIFQAADAGTKLWDTGEPGLYLLFGKKWPVYYVTARVGLAGQIINRRLGAAEPKEGERPGAISLDDARDEAKRIKADAKKGIAPEAAKRQAERKADAAKATAFGRPDIRVDGEVTEAGFGVAHKYFTTPREEGGGADLRSLSEAERKVRIDLAEWHDRPIAEITRREIIDLLRQKRKASPSAANRLQSLVSKIFTFAVAEDCLEAAPTLILGKAREPDLRVRHLSHEEIRLVWKAAERMGDPYGRIIRLLLTTGQRRNEIGAARRSEIGKLPYRQRDATTGREKTAEAVALKLPAERMKSGRPHTVPLSRLALSLIEGAPKPKDDDGEELDYDHLFVSGRRGDQPPSGWSRYKVGLDEIVGKLIAEEAEEPYDADVHKLEPWHVHDVRASVASLMEIEPLSIDQRTISRVLGHSEGGKGSTKKYLRHDFNSEAASALDRWAEELERIVGANVVALRKGA
ncbi:MAG TPA: tyrosine-type recombinase/integrase [Caulobacteraceae bacterium]|jgi:integrase